VIKLNLNPRPGLNLKIIGRGLGLRLGLGRDGVPHMRERIENEINRRDIEIIF